VTSLSLVTNDVADITPVRALAGLKSLTVQGVRFLNGRQINGKLTNLTPLAGMNLTYLDIGGNQVSDLSPLAGMKLTHLSCHDTNIADLKPLVGMPLVHLAASGAAIADLSPLKDAVHLAELDIGMSRVKDLTPLKEVKKLKKLTAYFMEVSDLTPLKGLPLTELRVEGTAVSDLSPLQGMKLVSLRLHQTKVADLSPLKDMKLEELTLYGTTVIDLSPLKGMPLKEIRLDFKPLRDTDILRSIKTLEKINEKPAAEFWKGVESAAKPIPEAWFKQVAALPAEKQVEAVIAKLKERNPGMGGSVSHRFRGGVVIVFSFSSDVVRDIAPLRALPELEILKCRGTAPGKGSLVDLTPLEGMRKLTSLSCQNMPVSDLTPLAGMKLTNLNCDGTHVTDLSPLRGMPLKILSCDFKPERDTEILRSIKTLERINDKPAAEFWKEVDAKKP
jgi:Leucine-rich repeat (LRR) protein